MRWLPDCEVFLALDKGILHRSISCFILASPTLQDFVFTKDRTKGWVEHGRTVEQSIHFNTPSCIRFKPQSQREMHGKHVDSTVVAKQALPMSIGNVGLD